MGSEMCIRDRRSSYVDASNVAAAADAPGRVTSSWVWTKPSTGVPRDRGPTILQNAVASPLPGAPLPGSPAVDLAHMEVTFVFPEHADEMNSPCWLHIRPECMKPVPPGSCTCDDFKCVECRFLRMQYIQRAQALWSKLKSRVAPHMAPCDWCAYPAGDWCESCDRAVGPATPICSECEKTIRKCRLCRLWLQTVKPGSQTHIEADSAWHDKASGKSYGCCAACDHRASGLKVCTGCLTMRYCNAECQTRHWQAHKAMCTFLTRRQLPNRVLSWRVPEFMEFLDLPKSKDLKRHFQQGRCKYPNVNVTPRV